MTSKMPVPTHEPELTAPVKLCQPNGMLNRAAVGWSRQPLHQCNLSGAWPRKKRWNYWAVTTPDFLFSVTVSSVDYIGMVFAYYIDFHEKKMVEQTVITPFGAGVRLGETVAGEALYESKQVQARLVDSGGTVSLMYDSPRGQGGPLAADLKVTRPANHETLNVVIPWSDSRYQFTSKQNSLPVTGTVRLGSSEFHLPEGRSFACLDFGRGIWPYECFWNWGSFSTPDLGINIGAGWTDGTGLNENGLWVKGRVEKLHEDMRITYNKSNFMQPWLVRSTQSKQVDLEFRPFFERAASTNALVIHSSVHQMFGTYHGLLRGADGQEMEVDGPVGWLEDHEAKW